MFPTGAGLAPKEVSQAKSKQDAHEAVCATRKTSREYAERRRGASRITAQDVCPASSLCPVPIPLDNVNRSFLPMRPLILLSISPRRGSRCCLSQHSSPPCPAVQRSSQRSSGLQCSSCIRRGSAAAPRVCTASISSCSKQTQPFPAAPAVADVYPRHCKEQHKHLLPLHFVKLGPTFQFSARPRESCAGKLGLFSVERRSSGVTQL